MSAGRKGAFVNPYSASQFLRQHWRWAVPFSCLQYLSLLNPLFEKIYFKYLWLCYIFSLFYRYFTGTVDPTQLTNMLWKFWFMQDTFVFYQLLGNDQSAVELRFTEPSVSFLQLNLECDPPLFLGYQNIQQFSMSKSYVFTTIFEVVAERNKL